ncbi:MAG: threonine/serine exporter family protein [Myxococcota bacterium]
MVVAASEDEPRRFLVALGRALTRLGTPAHRLEHSLERVAEALGLEAQIFSAPTMLMVAVGPPGDQHTLMFRVEPGDIDLGKLVAVDEVAQEVARGALDAAAGGARLRAIEEATPRYGAGLVLPSWAVVSAAVARFLGGRAEEAFVAGGIGLVIGAMTLALGRKPAGARVFDVVAAFVAAVGAGAAAAGLGTAMQITLLAGLIVLLPGLTLTTAMTELATRNLVSGTARLVAAAIVFLQLAFGVALGDRLVRAVTGTTPMVLPRVPVWWGVEAALLGFSLLALGVLFRAPRRSFPLIVIAGVIGFYGARLGAAAVGPELGAGLGGFAVALFGNVFARSGRGPALVPIVPGILLLVPGSIGFRSLTSMMRDDVVSGIDTAFAMFLVAVSIVAGLLFANVLLPPRRSL